MNEFILLFRLDIITKEAQPSPEQMQAYMKEWQKWVNGIDAQHKLSSGGNHLSSEGRVVKSGNVVTDGPYAELKESVAGYIIIKTTDFEDAVSIAKTCPILAGAGNSVEVRQVDPM
ncbi:YciI family protein [Chitinophaga sp. MM2321]|uniref:YciI family protein n=1 Tax=Chitinophaga sp. MM2321 TaxID=3137178 RepID=UPI0032D581A9